MQTSFVTIQVPLQPSTVDLRDAIEQELSHYGIPLRWAITALDRTTHIAYIEAIVTID